MANPTANSARELAGRYYLSIKRVEAILRLKGLEESWKKVCPPCLFFTSQILAE
jgi:Eukaryotic mitochondrial regulator protein